MRNSNTLKKLISSIIALAMLISLSVPVGAFAESGISTDSASHAQKAYDFLKAVGAMDSGEVPFDASMVITRAHFVKLTLHLSNDAPNVLISDDEVFSDVTPATQYENYIETAYRIGYISGSTSSMFEPSEAITLAQALKIICNVLGYQKFAEANGGFPGGYFIMAQRLDLLEGVTIDDNQPLDMANAMILLRNASETKIMQITGIGENGLELETVGDETLLYKNHNVSCEEGIISANGYTDLLSNESELDKNQVCVNNIVFNAEDSDAQEYIGYSVRIYYKNNENKSVKNVIYTELTEENREYEAISEELEISSDRVNIEYEDGSSKSFRLSSKVTYILNGKMAIMSPEDLLSVDKGSIRFISNDDDNVIDVVKVKKYDTLIVSGISVSSGIIVAADGSKLEFDPDSDEYTFSISKNGTPTQLSSIAQNDVLLVSEGAGTGLRHIEILASNQKIEGAFEEIGDEHVIIAGKQYKLDTALNNSVVLGKAYVILIDAFGSVAYVKTNNDIVYGYLYGLVQQGMNKPMCRIFTENNRWVDLYFAKKVNFNGENVEADVLYANLIKNDYRQLIRYNVNDNREVIRLETASEHLLGSKNEKLAAENDIFRISYSGSAQFRSSNKSLDGKIIIDANAKIFNIPVDMNKDDFAVKTTAVFSGDTSYSITAYDADKYMTAKAVVTSSVAKDTTVTSADKFMVVKSIGEVLNSEGDAVPAISGYWNDMEISFPVLVGDGYVSAETMKSLKKGDAILFKYDDDSNIITVKRYSLDDQTFISQKAYYGTTNGIVVCGKVDEIDAIGRKIRVASLEEGDTDHRGVIYTTSTKIAIWEKATETYRTCTVSEIIPGDTILMNMRYFQCNDILIIRD